MHLLYMHFMIALPCRGPRLWRCGILCRRAAAPVARPKATHLPCRLNSQDPVLLLFAIRRGQFVEVTFQEKSVLLRQPFVAQTQLMLYFLQQFLLMRRYQCPCGLIMYQDTPVDPLAVCHLQELRDKSR